MAYQKEETTDDDMRRYGAPHPHWTHNMKYAQEKLNDPEIREYLKKKDIGFYWDGARKDAFGNWEIVTVLAFTWVQGNYNMGNPISLHQSQNKFIEQWEKFFGIKGGPISKRGVYSPRRDAYADS